MWYLNAFNYERLNLKKKQQEFYDKKSVTHFNAINPELGALDEEKYEVENPEEWDSKIDEAVKFFESEIVKLEKELEELNEVA